MDPLTDGSKESENSENASKRRLEHSPSTLPGSTAFRTFAQLSTTKKVGVILAVVIAIKTTTILVFGDNAVITTLFDLLIQGLQERMSN